MVNNLPKVLKIYKNIGETPLEAIEKYQSKHPEFNNIKIAYAGRLDPMAKGLLLCLVGDECKRRDEYQNLDKTYKFKVLPGVSTDTYDLLGMIQKHSDINDNLSKQIATEFLSLKGKVTLAYPPYSSKVVKGKPLFYWAREGKLDEISIPEKEIEIYNTKYLSEGFWEPSELQKEIVEKINKVKGDFRQEEILTSWNRFFCETEISIFTVLEFEASVKSGTYIRSLINLVSKKINFPLTTFEIERTRVGEFEL